MNDATNHANPSADPCGAPHQGSVELCEHGRYVDRCVDCGAAPLGASVAPPERTAATACDQRDRLVEALRDAAGRRLDRIAELELQLAAARAAADTSTFILRRVRAMLGVDSDAQVLEALRTLCDVDAGDRDRLARIAT
jgi:hypothetical protein